MGREEVGDNDWEERREGKLQSGKTRNNKQCMVWKTNLLTV